MDSTIVQDLPPPAWQDNPFPQYRKMSGDFKFRQAVRTWPYVDVQGHDYTGRDSSPFELELYFINTCTIPVPNGYARWFPEYYQAVMATMQTGKAGNLDHPLLGRVRAVLKAVHFEISADNLSGALVRAQWEETNESPSTTIAFFGNITTSDPATLAGNADALCAYWNVSAASSLPSMMVLTQFGLTSTSTVSLRSLWGSIASSVFSFTSAVLGAINSLVGIVDTMIDAINALDSVLTWQADDALLSFRAYLVQASVTIAQQSRPVASRTLSEPTTLDQFAAQTGNDLSDIIKLNVTYLGQPEVPKRSTLRYYASAA